MRLGVGELAKELGVSPSAVGKATKQGRIRRGEDGLYDVDECRSSFRSSHPIQQANARKQQSPERQAAGASSMAAPPPAAGDRSLAEAVRQEKWLKVEKERLAVAEKRESLLDAQEVHDYEAHMILDAKEAFLAIPVDPELKKRLAQETDELRIENLLYAEIYRALGRMAHRPAKSAAA